MGTWGPGIFDDDVAIDVRREFEARLDRGDTVEAATQHVLRAFSTPLTDEEDASVVYLALAHLQRKAGAIEPWLRDRALAVIDSGIPLWRWEGQPAQRVAERKQVLDDLRASLS